MELHQEGDRIVNEAGEVAMSFFQELPKVVRMPDKTQYVFRPQHNVSIAFVRPEHVDEVLRHVHICCGGHKRNAFKFPNMGNVRLWLGYER